MASIDADDEPGMDFLDAIVSDMPPGPAERELIPLVELDLLIMRAAAIRAKQTGKLPRPKAGAYLVRALLGEVKAGPITAGLAVYRTYRSGPIALADEDIVVDDDMGRTRFVSERERILRSVLVKLVHSSLDEISEAQGLALVCAEAMVAFGLDTVVWNSGRVDDAPSKPAATEPEHVQLTPPGPEKPAWGPDDYATMFRWRYIDKLSDKTIAQRIDRSPGRVNQMIGSKDAWKLPGSYDGKPWEPPDELLAECGLVKKDQNGA